MHVIVLLYKCSNYLLPKTCRAQRLTAVGFQQWRGAAPRDEDVSQFPKQLHAQKESIPVQLPASTYSTASDNFSQISDSLAHIKKMLYSGTFSGSSNGNNHKVNGHVSVAVNLHNPLKWSHHRLKIWSQIKINTNKYNNASLNTHVLSEIPTNSWPLLSNTDQYWANVHQKINLFLEHSPPSQNAQFLNSKKPDKIALKTQKVRLWIR